MMKKITGTLLLLISFFTFAHMDVLATKQDIKKINEPLKHWTITFSEAVDPNTINSNIYVTDEKGTIFPTEIEYLDHQIKVQPLQDYKANELYTIHIKENVKSKKTNTPLQHAIQFQFLLVKQESDQGSYLQSYRVENTTLHEQSLALPSVIDYILFFDDGLYIEDKRDFLGTIKIPPGGYAIISTKQNITVANTDNFKFMVSSQPAYIMHTLQSDQTIELRNKGDNKLHVSVDSLSYQYAAYVNGIPSDYTEHTTNPTVSIPGFGSLQITANKITNLVIPNNVEIKTVTETAVSSYTLQPGKSVLIKNKNENKVRIYLDKYTKYDISTYSKIRIDSDVIETSDSGDTQLISKGEAVITNKGDKEMTINAPSANLYMSDTYEPAIKREALGKGETTKITKSVSTGLLAYFHAYHNNEKAFEEGSFDYVRYENGNPEKYRHQQHYYETVAIPRDGELLITNNGETVYVYLPYRYTQFHAYFEPALQITELFSNETLEVQMNTDSLRYQYIQVYGDAQISAESFYRDEVENVLRVGDSELFTQSKFETSDILIGTYTNRKIVEAFALIENTGILKAKVVTPRTHFTLKKVNEPVFTETIIYPKQTVTIKPAAVNTNVRAFLLGEGASFFVQGYTNDEKDFYPLEGNISPTVLTSFGLMSIEDKDYTKHVKRTVTNTSNVPLKLYTSYRTGIIIK